MNYVAEHATLQYLVSSLNACVARPSPVLILLSNFWLIHSADVTTSDTIYRCCQSRNMTSWTLVCEDASVRRWWGGKDDDMCSFWFRFVTARDAWDETSANGKLEYAFDRPLRLLNIGLVIVFAITVWTPLSLIMVILTSNPTADSAGSHNFLVQHFSIRPI